VAKTFRDPEGEEKTTYYSRDASGNVMAVYQGEELAEQPIYGSSRLGMYIGGNGPGKRIWTNKRYELTNHLGNVMVVVSDRIIKKDPETAGPSSPGGPPSPVQLSDFMVFAEVLTINDYYPFGLEMPGRSVNFREYRYGFNGKEKDDKGEWGSTHYDYGFRIYNPQIGKFLSVDPLASSYPWYTPYQFAGNKPIWKIDLDGLEEADSKANKETDYLENRIAVDPGHGDKADHYRDGKWVSSNWTDPGTVYPTGSRNPTHRESEIALEISKYVNLYLNSYDMQLESFMTPLRRCR
jgi:RHS repeat-associated protein